MVVAFLPHVRIDSVVRLPVLDRLFRSSGGQHDGHLRVVLQLHGHHLARLLPAHRQRRLLRLPLLQLPNLWIYQSGLDGRVVVSGDILIIVM